MAANVPAAPKDAKHEASIFTALLTGPQKNSSQKVEGSVIPNPPQLFAATIMAVKQCKKTSDVGSVDFSKLQKETKALWGQKKTSEIPQADTELSLQYWKWYLDNKDVKKAVEAASTADCGIVKVDTDEEFKVAKAITEYCAKNGAETVDMDDTKGISILWTGYYEKSNTLHATNIHDYTKRYLEWVKAPTKNEINDYHELLGKIIWLQSGSNYEFTTHVGLLQPNIFKSADHKTGEKYTDNKPGNLEKLMQMKQQKK